MSANDTARPALRTTIDDLDEAIYQIGGCVHAMRLLSEEFGTHTASPESSAFWAILAGLEGFVAQAQGASDSIHEQTREVRV